MAAAAGVVAYSGTMEWGDNLVVIAFVGAFVVIPIGLMGLAVTSDSTGERVASSIVATVMVFFDAVLVLIAIDLSNRQLRAIKLD